MKKQENPIVRWIFSKVEIRKNTWLIRSRARLGQPFFSWITVAGVVLAGLAGSGCVDSGRPVSGAAEHQYITDRIMPPEIPDREKQLTDFAGQIVDGNDIRFAVQAGIDALNKLGGGRFTIPAGDWFCSGSIRLKSGVELHISEGATLTFSQLEEGYLPQVLTRWEGTEAFNISPLIYGWQVRDVAITGKGIINGNGEGGFVEWRADQTAAQAQLREQGAKGIPVHERIYAEKDRLRPVFIQCFSCERIRIEDITLVNSPMWVMHLIYTSHGVVRGVTVESFQLNNDGLVLDSSEYILVEGNRFTTGDDSIVLKSGRDQDGWRVGVPTRHILIRDNTLSGHNALAIGSEMSGGVSDIYMYGNILENVRSALYFKSNLDRGGYIERVRISDIHVEEALYLLRFSTDYHSHRGERHPVRYNDFEFTNIVAERVGTAIFAQGVPEEPIRGVRISNMKVNQADVALDTTFVENFTLRNVMINGKEY